VALNKAPKLTPKYADSNLQYLKSRKAITLASLDVIKKELAAVEGAIAAQKRPTHWLWLKTGLPSLIVRWGNSRTSKSWAKVVDGQSATLDVNLCWVVCNGASTLSYAQLLAIAQNS